MRKSIRLALCQINTTPGDLPGNELRIRTAYEAAAASGADLCVFPEMALVGYSPRDLLFRERLVADAERRLTLLAESTLHGPAMLVGTVSPHRGPGRPLANVAALLDAGEVRARVAKTLLPDYDVFDEARYFEPAGEVRPIPFRGTQLGITVCEDLWVESQGPEVPRYTRDPAATLAALGADVILNLSASPYHWGKPSEREGLVSRTAARLGVPVALCNLWGGNDEILFDGASCVASSTGSIIRRGERFQDDILLVSFPLGDPGPLPDELDPLLELRGSLVCGITDYARKCGFSQAVVGLSGGVDSALTASLAAEALGPENVTGVAMPSPYSSAGSLADAEDLARRLRIQFHTVPIQGPYESLLKGAQHVVGEAPFGVMEENLQARVRGVILMAVSNRTGALVITTGNKSELAVGYCTLYGDMCGGLAAISDVYKTDVYRLARQDAMAGRIPWNTIEKPPSAELRPGQLDQDSLPPYEVLDAILRRHVDQNLGAREILEQMESVDRATVLRVMSLVARSEYKRSQAAPGLRVSAKAFGIGRRVPIVSSSLAFLDSRD